MKNNNYLNEEEYNKISKKINKIGSILLIVGGLMILLGIVMCFVLNKITFGFFIVFGLAFMGFGGQTKILGNGRKISAYFAQQQMPVAKEGIEKMAPSVGVAAKEISKGIKEGLKDDNSNNKE